ncbi:superoxide dismutase [Nocardioides zeae]|uniref:Superoxide dismutase n=1 Tax=Nocardioides zeae TaxID=1457234 RepID=A0A6P0HFD4_9ACTN|nr:superoxide dismutase [Nocardioides zeae]NEN77246.1 superoxide dismutase [Nocardioides zeae]
MSDYVLPDLPYDFGALEPYISGAIMELHHDKHHATYVKGVNSTLEQLEEARETSTFTHLTGLEKSLSFHLGGHLNHSIFWPNMSPHGGDKPTGELAQAIDEFFGSFDQFRAQFHANALGIQGSGWSILAWDVLGERLHVVQLYDQQGNLPACLVPLLMLDMWEHAYYLDYKNDKATFVAQWWNIANWADVQDRFERARAQTPGLLA